MADFGAEMGMELGGEVAVTVRTGDPGRVGDKHKIATADYVNFSVSYTEDRGIVIGFYIYNMERADGGDGRMGTEAKLKLTRDEAVSLQRFLQFLLPAE